MSTHILDNVQQGAASKHPRSGKDKSLPTDRLLDVHEAAAILGLKPSTLYQWAYERKIPVVKLFGRALRFRLSVVQKLIADSERPALSSIAERETESDRPERE